MPLGKPSLGEPTFSQSQLGNNMSEAVLNDFNEKNSIPGPFTIGPQQPRL